MMQQTLDGGFAEDQKTIGENILMLVECYPQLKDDYGELVQAYWWFASHKSPESITRCFRKLVSEGKIILNPGTEERRRRQERKYREFFGRGST